MTSLIPSETVDALISVEKAIEEAQKKEDSVRDASLILDRELHQFRDKYSLPHDRKQWVSTFTSQIISLNKDHRRRIREELRGYAYTLLHLHARAYGSEGQDAICVLVGLLVDTLKAERQLSSLLDEFDTIQTRLSARGQLTLPDRVFIRRTLPSVVTCRNKLRLDTTELKVSFDRFKDCFYVLSREDELKKTLAALHARKISRESVSAKARPAFRTIWDLYDERERIIASAVYLGFEHGRSWFSLETGMLSVPVFEKELRQYDVLKAACNGQQELHSEAIQILRALEADAASLPRGLPGPNMKEIQVDQFGQAFEAYEHIAITCKELLDLANPIIDTLRAYISTLRKGNALNTLLFGA